MTVENARNQAEANFLNGYNCTQSVFCVFARELGLNEDLALKISQPLGGGMCRMREVCGAVSGMLLALGLNEGSSNVSDKNAKDRIYGIGQKLSAQFREHNGSIECRELLGLVPPGTSEKLLKKELTVEQAEAQTQSLRNGENSVTSGNALSSVSEARTAEYYKKRPCPKLCADAAGILAEYLEQTE